MRWCIFAAFDELPTTWMAMGLRSMSMSPAAAEPREARIERFRAECIPRYAHVSGAERREKLRACVTRRCRREPGAPERRACAAAH